MKAFGEYITEAKKKDIDFYRNDFRLAAMKAIKAMSTSLPDFDVSDRTIYRTRISFMKQLVNEIEREGNVSVIKKNIGMAKDYLRMVKRDAGYGRSMKTDTKAGKEAKASVAKIRANPITICDILADEKDRRFVSLMKDGGPEVALSTHRGLVGRSIGTEDIEAIGWVQRLNAVSTDMGEWFDQQGGKKQTSVNAIRDCAACRGRAAWTKWSGKAYRGVGRSIGRIKRYTYTGEMIRRNNATWLVAKVNYKGKYGAQSWTPSWNSAAGFNEGGDIQVVLEVELKEGETFLRPEVIDKISGYKGEKEVIRVSDRMVPATAYVKLYDIVIKDAEKHPGRITAAYAKRWAEGLFGAEAAKKLLADRGFMKVVGMV
jgi:hypothetical protein